MKKVLFIPIFFVLLSHSLHSQTFDWARTVGSQVQAAATATSGSIYSIGYFSGVVDFDPGAGSYTLGITGSTDLNLFISVTDSAGNFLNAYATTVITGGGYIYPRSVALDVSGNIYITGYYATSSVSAIDFDPGPASYSVTSLSSQPVCFVLKLDASANLVWMRSLEGSGGISVGNSIGVDGSGNVYNCGYYKGTIDFDPGVSTYTAATTSTLNNGFAVKLSSAGSFLWAQEITGTGSSNANGLSLDASGAVFLTGQYAGTVDLDPGAGTYSVVSAGADDLFALKLSTAGSFSWAASMGGPLNNYGTAIKVDASGNCYITGASSGSGDFDPGTSSYSLTASSAADIIIIKLNASAGFVWAKNIGCPSGGLQQITKGTAIDVDAMGNVFTTGSIGGNSSPDFDPGTGSYLVSVASGSFCTFISELDASGNFVWAATLGAGEGRSIICFGPRLYLAGRMLGYNDLDPTAGTYTVWSNVEGFILKLSDLPFFSGPRLFCSSGGSVSATYSAAYNSSRTYSWSVSSSATVTSVASATVNVNLPVGTSTVFLSITSGTTTVTRSVAVTVGANPTLVVTAAPSLSVCQGSSLTLTAGGASSYAWVPSAVNGVPFQAWVSFVYTVTGTSSLGCIGTATAAVNVSSVVPQIGIQLLPSATVCSGSTISIGQTSQNVVSYTWTPGVTLNQPFAVTSSQGWTVVASSANGCTASASASVTVYPSPTVTAVIVPSPTVCAGTSVTFSATGSGGPYSWTGGITNNTPFEASAGGVFTVTTPANANGCFGKTTVSLVVIPAPVIGAILTPAFACAGSTFMLSGTGASTFSWSGSISNGVPFVPITSTNYVVSGTSSAGCIGSSTIPVTVFALPQVGAVVLPSATVCAGSTLNLNGTGATSYSWTGGVQNATTFTAAASAVYTVTGTSSSGCTNTAVVPVIVNALPTISFVALPSAAVCAGTALNLSGTGATSYSWSGGISNNTTFTATASNIYTLTGTDANGCKNDLPVTITVNPRPVVTATALPSPTVCAGSTIAVGGAGASTYAWTGSIMNNNPFVAVASQSYIVTGTDNKGCSNSATIAIVVNALPVLSVSALPASTVCVGENITLTAIGASSYSWTNYGTATTITVTPLSTTNYTVVGLSAQGCSASKVYLQAVDPCTELVNNGVAEYAVTVYPNPGNGLFHVKSNRLNNASTITIYDLSGRRVHKQTLESDISVLDLESLAKGIYLYIITDDARQVNTGRVVVE
jgi:hypothetical protein